MKRKAEFVLTIIGIVFYLFVATVGGLLATLKTNDAFVEGFVSEFETNTDFAKIFVSEMETGVNESVDVAEVIELLGIGGFLILIISLVCIVFGIMAAILLKKNSYPKTIGITLILLAIVSPFLSFGLCIMAGFFYLVAGIVTLVKKNVKNPNDTTNLNAV